ncbi:hypothetical protein EDD11_007510 [Mortierella claussenii]|nr:hypothetical protein EDD11_007510 [Mortierella claussenii]
MPFVETLESYSRALYLPLRGYVRRPFQFVTESIRDHVPSGLSDMRRAMEHSILGSSRIAVSTAEGSVFDGFGWISGLNSKFSGVSSTGGNTHHGGSLGTDAGDSARSAAGSTAGSAGPGHSSSGTKILQSQPSMIQFFTSPYFLLLCFMNIVLNRINAIVAPRNPHPLKLSVRFALKLPAFYLLMKSAIIMLALLLQSPQQPSTSTLAWIVSDLRTYTESHALWLSFIAMGVSCTVDSFISNLDSANNSSEHTINMLEWAILFHFTPSGRDVLIIALIQVCQLLTLQCLSLSSRGRNYRLIATTFWGMLDLMHFAHAVYSRPNNYPSIQLLTRLPEVVVILMVFISMTVHALTYIVTGGNVRRQMFEARALPSRAEEYGVAVFKVGRACMEATRGVGLRNEVDAIVIPLGTILDRKPSNKLRSSQRSSEERFQSRQTSNTFSFPNGSAESGQAPAGFSNEMADVVETPSQRHQLPGWRNRINVMRAFWLSSISLMIELGYGAYNRVVPARYRRTPRGHSLGTRMSIQDYIQLRTTIEHALERAHQTRQIRLQEYEAERYKRAAALDEEEEEELYNDFLSRDLTATDDEDEDFDVDYMAQFESEDEDDDEADEDESEPVSENAESPNQLSIRQSWAQQVDAGSVESYGMRRCLDTLGDHSDDDDDNEAAKESDRDLIGPRSHVESAWRSLESWQDFFLDTSFMSIFLSGRLQDTPLTRSQYRLAMSGAREFQQEHDDGSSGSGSSSVLSRRNKGPSDDGDKRTLLAVLNRYRKTAADKLPTTIITGSTDMSGMSPPPLAKPPSTAGAQDDNTIYSRLLCVVCQSEPRGVLLRPCRCLALCNECREVLASRRFKQCPCCRADVQGFSKIYLP